VVCTWLLISHSIFYLYTDWRKARGRKTEIKDEEGNTVHQNNQVFQWTGELRRKKTSMTKTLDFLRKHNCKFN
jgi:hypothetical protein